VTEAAALFNIRGFAGTSMSDVSSATGLEKGGVYNHFASKDDLALAAFDYAAGLIVDRLTAELRARGDGLAQLNAMLDLYAELGMQPFVRGGCPILNTAVEADDTHPRLRDRAREVLGRWLQSVTQAVEAAVADGQLRADIDARGVAATIVAGIEGGMMVTRLYGDESWMRAIVAQLRAYVDSLRAPAR
jgi:AcrR family transcriptional regulator